MSDKSLLDEVEELLGSRAVESAPASPVATAQKATQPAQAPVDVLKVRRMPAKIANDRDYFAALRSAFACLDHKNMLLSRLEEARKAAHAEKAGVENKPEFIPPWQRDKQAAAPAKKELTAQRTYEQLTRTVEQHNVVQRQQLAKLRARIDAARRAGVYLTVEHFADQYELDAFERTVLGFFLYLELEYGKARTIELRRQYLVHLFSTREEGDARLLLLRYFTDDARLMAKRILLDDSDNNCPNDISLNAQALRLISDALYTRQPVLPHTVLTALEDTRPPAREEEQEPRLRREQDGLGVLSEPRVTLDRVRIPARDKESVLMFLKTYADPRLRELGVFETLTDAQGLVMLFHGAPGTGKSMLAEAVAHELKRKLYSVALGGVVDKYIGETEKHIARIFAEAKKQNAVLLIDEADSLLYSRGSATHEHDIRCVNALLCELQRCEGVVILTSNMAKLMDAAVERRIALKLEFHKPDAATRAEIWANHLPPKVGRDADIDFAALAKRYEFAGGNIKNAVLSALRRMVLDGRETLCRADLEYGAQLERDGMFADKAQGRQITGFTLEQIAS